MRPSQTHSSLHAGTLKELKQPSVRVPKFLLSSGATAQKHSAGDTRMKQKARALEEAVKQAIKCREDVETEYVVLEAARVEQEAELADASRRFEATRVRAEEWRARREKAEEEAGSRLQGARTTSSQPSRPALRSCAPNARDSEGTVCTAEEGEMKRKREERKKPVRV